MGDDGELWGPLTARAVENFAISGQTTPQRFLVALALVKRAAAETNAALGLLDSAKAAVIAAAAMEIERGEHWDQFPIDVHQTGSGTSSNMNCNEVIASLCQRRAGISVRPTT